MPHKGKTNHAKGFRATRAGGAFVAALAAVLMLAAGTKGFSRPALAGPWLGQAPPGRTPVLFAPGIVSAGLMARDVAMTPDGNEIYFSLYAANYDLATILVSRLVDGRWTEPAVAPHMEDPAYVNLEPCISPDGKRFFFLSGRPDPATGRAAGEQDIWVMDRMGKSWSEPYNLGQPVNTDGQEYFPSVTRDGTLYFTRAEKGSRIHFIYRARWRDGRYETPEKLPEAVNTGTNRYNAYVAPDESYIIVPAVGRPECRGGTDYFITFRDGEDRWHGPVPLGPEINTSSPLEFSPYVSPDGRFFFFMSARFPSGEELPARLSYRYLMSLRTAPLNGQPAIWWMDAGFIGELRAKVLPTGQ